MPERAASLNYHHLLYFWLTAREGSLTAASELLDLAPSTLSSQIRSLEQQMGRKLFERLGRKLVLTEDGQLVARYADEIFGLGAELADVVGSRRRSRHPRRIAVGAARSLPKVLVCRLLEPLLESLGPVHLVVRHDAAEVLVSELAVHRTHLVLSDTPVRLCAGVPAFSRLLGSSSVSLMASADLAPRLRDGFPGSLDGAPLLLPDSSSEIRRLLEAWIDGQRIRPRLVGELEDSSLLKAFGRRGAGVFPVPSVVADEVAEQYRVELVGELPDVHLSFFLTALYGSEDGPVVKAVLEQAARSRMGA